MVKSRLSLLFFLGVLCGHWGAAGCEWGLGVVAAAEQAAVGGSRPNVVFLLLDDAGWTDTDIGQTRDLADIEPQQLERMKHQLAELYADVLAEGISWDIPERYQADANHRVWNSE
jgi:hypothetical protein